MSEINEQFEKLAEQFRKETGIWPPGKSMPTGMYPQDESAVRAEFFAYWIANRWIPVSERLPEKDNYVLTTNGEHFTTDRYYKDDACGHRWQSENPYQKHTHWMPIVLPESE